MNVSVPIRLQHAGTYGAIVLLHLCFALQMPMPAVFYDEAVYLGIARFLAHAGPLLNLTGGGYGEFGYAALIAPAFALPGDFHAHYVMVEILNAVFISTAYFGAYYVLTRIAGLERLAIPAAAAVTCYTSYLLFDASALTENVYVPIFLFTIAALHRWLVTKTVLAGALFGLLVGLLFSIHSPAIGVLAVSALLLAALALASAPMRLSATVALAILAAAYLVTERINRFLMVAGWHRDHDPTLANVNATIITVLGVKAVAISALGQLTYAGACTFGIAFAGIGFYRYLMASDDDSARRVALRYGIACTLATFVISCAANASFDPTVSRIDFLMVGRYNEGVLAFLMCLGFAGLIGARGAPNRDRIRWAAGAVLFTTVCAFMLLPKLHHLVPMSGAAVRINILAFEALYRILAAHLAIIFAVAIACGLCIMGLLIRAPLAGLGAFAVLCMGLAAGEVRKEYRPIARGNWNGGIVWRLPPLLAQLPQGTRVQYDMTVWNAGLYSWDQLLAPGTRFEQFSSDLLERPQTDYAIASRSFSDAAYTLIDCEQIADNCLWKRRARN